MNRPDDWTQEDEARRKLISRGLALLFLANNRTATQILLTEKTMLLYDSMKGIATGKISDFFKFLRENYDTLPSDAKILKALRDYSHKFGKVDPRYQIGPEPPWGTMEKDKAKQYSDKYPEFSDLFIELTKSNNPYPSNNWKQKFFERIGRYRF